MNIQQRTMPRLKKVIVWIVSVALFVIIGRYVLLNYTVSGSRIYILTQDYTYHFYETHGANECLLINIDIGGEACGYCVDNKYPNASTIIRVSQCYREL
jgi:uncharacterized protein YuzE